MKQIIVGDKGVCRSYTKACVDIIKEQEEFMISLCNPGEEILSFVKANDIKYPILQEIP